LLRLLRRGKAPHERRTWISFALSAVALLLIRRRRASRGK
jgi:hypothetical protein